jgi:hypothetical protein
MLTDRAISVERSPIPTVERKTTWRAAYLACRPKRREGASDQAAHEVAIAAVHSVLLLRWKVANAEAVDTVAYVSWHHSEWFAVSGEG